MVESESKSKHGSNKIPVKNIMPASATPSELSQGGEPIYVRKVSGFFQQLRQKMNFVFMAVFALLPWLQYNGQQALLFDLIEQRFALWGITLWPQDLTLLAWLFIIGAFLLFFVTTFLGRVWCGYLCPQTVWTFIFIWFEEKIEGSANQRKKLDSQKLSGNKLWRKALKHSCWLLFSLLTALTFAGYFSPIHDVFIDFFTLQASSTLVIVTLFFAGCTYGNAGWMREIMCVHMCPYARFQSAMFDKDTLTVSYDYNRGEGRGPRTRKQDPKAMNLGDCIDCNLCVQVCPTGIDIRDGLQYECINCGACADACDGVMERMNYAKGLIRYTTEHQLQGNKVHLIRPKLVGYALVLLVMSSLFAIEVTSRVPVSLDIIRDRNELAKENFDGRIENVYTLRVLNKSQNDNVYKLSLKGIENTRWYGEQQVTVKAASVYTLPISISVAPEELEEYMTNITFVIELVSADEEVKLEHESRFFNKR